MNPPPYSSAPPSSQVLDHTSSMPSPPSLHRTSLPTISRTNNMSTSEQQSASAANAAALESTKSTQAGFSFLSLPPEIRNKIYHYIFTKDSTCWRIHQDTCEPRLKGVRGICSLCRSTLRHKICRLDYSPVRNMHFVFRLSGNPTRSGVLQTCNTIINEALPISLACIHISIVCYEISTVYLTRALELFLTYMRQPKGAYFSVFTCTYYRTLPGNRDDVGNFSEVINGAGLRTGCLILQGNTSMTNRNIGIGKYFAANLDRLENKPAKVEWTQSAGRISPQYETERCKFNEAAKKWLAQLAKVKADPNARMPLLRDFLPQFFEN
jgi:hypothetical protein